MDLDLHNPLIGDYCATFFCWNLSGQMTGYQRYNPNGDRKIFNHSTLGRYYTYRMKTTISVWGLESYFISTGPLFITEGIFDACRLTFRGQSAIAVLTNSPPKDYKNWLKCLNRPIIAICDDDEAGQELIEFGDNYEIVPNKDLGDSSEEYVSYIINKWT